MKMKRGECLPFLAVLIAVTLISAGCAGGGGYGVEVTVSGLSGTVVLQNNGDDDLTVTSDGTFEFETSLPVGSAYEVTVDRQPYGQSCFVANGTGTIADADVTDVTVECHDSGSLDATFGSGGIVVSHDAAGGGGEDSGYSITTGPGGKILVAGKSLIGHTAALPPRDDYGIVTWKYNPDGTPDTAFGNDGVVVYSPDQGGIDTGFSITTDSEGKILVAGQVDLGGYTYAVILKYASDGTPEGSFDDDGTVLYDIERPYVYAGYSITTDSKDKVLVTGFRHESGIITLRYNGDGTPDNSFDSDGTALYHDPLSASDSDYGYSIAIDSKERILVTGYSTGSNSMLILRYKSDGELDASFGKEGVVFASSSGLLYSTGRSITTDSEDRILVAGAASRGSDLDMEIWRYNEDGTPDTAFGSDGVVVSHNAAGGDGDDVGQSVVIDSRGRILVTGYSMNSSGDADMVIWRYNEDGTPDAAFDDDGIAVFHNAAGGDGTDLGSSIAIDSIGRLLVTGWSSNGSDNDMTIWRVIP
ncbi:MAG: hypothetical protein GXO94_02280 [Nitrospirae bacterium]|nr:hypothetical protein [Nitrospirota bacterium]